VVNTGLVEVPFGATLREVVFDIGGGVTDRRGKVSGTLKAVQIGGPSGGCLNREHLDLPLDYDSLRAPARWWARAGWCHEPAHCMVSIARFFMDFTQRESCGKCVLCGRGPGKCWPCSTTSWKARANGETLALLEKLARAVQKGSLCGLGKTAPNPCCPRCRIFARSTTRTSSTALSDRPVQGAGQPAIDPVKCKGCTACAASVGPGRDSR
jgi:NADH-quinone oxidoreductase subunit F